MKELYFNYSWSKVSDDRKACVIREFLDNGVSHFVLTCDLLLRAVQEPDFLKRLQRTGKEMGVTFGAPHGLCDRPWDLNEPDERQRMLEAHKRALAICGDFGARTYTVHPGAYWHCTKHLEVPMLRENTIRSIEELLPVAERNHIILSVENSFEPTNSAKEVLTIVSHFGDHPWLGVTYDIGHANCMASAPWKVPEGYPDYQYQSWWQNGIITEDGALDTLASRVVTCHIHDNDGYRDLHGMPGDGCIDWNGLMPRLMACPKMTEYQTEVNYCDGENWAGKCLAPVGGYSVRRVVEVFRKLFGQA